MHPFPAPTMLGRSMSPEAEALFARMSTPPNQYRRFLINRLINALKPDGTWAALDWLHVEAAADSQAACLNWKSTSYGLTAVNSPTFTADRGFLGDGAAAYLSFAYSASPAQNSHSLGAWLNIADSVGGVAVGTTNGSMGLRPRISGSLRSEENGATASTTVSDSLGFSAFTRTGAAGVTFQKNATQTPVTLASLSLGGGAAGVLAYSTGGGFGGFSDGRVAADFGAGTTGLTTAQLTTLYNALNTYLTAIGGA